MMHWKLSALTFALGAAATVGFVWLKRSPERKRLPVRVGGEDAGDAARLDDRARDDAIHDLGTTPSEASALDWAEPMDAEPISVRSLDEEPLAGDEDPGEEHYDAIDPEDIGSEWLRRATEAPSIRPEAPHGTEAALADVAPELPVGTTDPAGNTELHEAGEGSRTATELSPNDEELAQRRANESERGSSGDTNG